MRLMPTKSPSFSECEMQEHVANYFTQRRFMPSDWTGQLIIPKVYREININKIGRISDVIVYITSRKIVNIECKLTDYETVYRQAMDHLKWADYSYVCLCADTYLPAYIIDKMITTGIGLLLWNPGTFVEVIQSGFNKEKDKDIRQIVLAQLKKKDCIQTAEKELNNQETFLW